MRMNSINIYDILTSPEFESVKNSFKCELSVTVQNSEPARTETVTVITPEYFKNRLLTRFPSWSVLVPETVENKAQHFLMLWDTFLNESKKCNFAKLYENFTYKYNPIENYDKYSTITVKYKGTETNTDTMTGKESETVAYTGSETDTLTKAGSETNTLSYNGEVKTEFETADGGYIDTVKTQNNPEDSETFYNTGLNTTTTAKRDDVTTQSFTERSDENKLEFDDREDTRTREFTNREDTKTKEFTNRSDTHTRTFGNREDETTDRTHGNIGISTPMDMALKELTARKFELMPQLISDFIWEYGVI